MQDIKHIIEPERLGLWVAVVAIISILALSLSLVALKRLQDATVITQAEVLVLMHKVKALEDQTKTSDKTPSQNVQAQ